MDALVASSQRLVAEFLALVVGRDTGMVTHSVTLGPSDEWPASDDGDLPASVAVVIVDQPEGLQAEAEAVARFRARWDDAAFILLRRTGSLTTGRGAGYRNCHAVPATISPGTLVKVVQRGARHDRRAAPTTPERPVRAVGWADTLGPSRHRRPRAERGTAVVDTVRAARLTDREREILALLSAGLGGDAIAAAVGISVHTVRTHLQNVMRKLDVRTRLQAVTVAYRDGLLGAGVGPVRGPSEGAVLDR